MDAPTHSQTVTDEAPSRRRRYALPPHVYLCPFTAGSVLLDLKCNRYLGIDAQATAELTALLQSTTEASEENPTAQRWIRRGLLGHSPSSRTQPFAPTLPAVQSSIEALVRPRLWPSDLARFGWACVSARRSLRKRSLWQIACDLRTHRERRAVRPAFSADELAAAVARFRRLRPLAFTARDQCLFHALALTKFLEAAQLPAVWVIGVRLTPWGAHSWVQHGERVLDATPESVHEFHPIIAV